LFWQQPSGETAAVVDAAREAERLKGAKTGGETAAEPERPAGEPKKIAAKAKKKGWLDGLF
ncbi:MAG: hypothetical protein ABL951_05360, partial [Alphaproteobacteria bacterium]